MITMNCRSTFETLVLCQLSDNRIFQGYLQLTFPSLVGPQHSKLHYSLSNVGLSYCEKCGSATFSISLPMSPPPSSLCNHSFRSYQNPVNRQSLDSCQLQLSELPKLELTFLSTVAFRATKTPTTLRADVPVPFGATKTLEDTMLPVTQLSGASKIL